MRAILATAFMAALLCSPVMGEPVIKFEETRIVANGLTPAGQVIWFGVARERPAWKTRMVRYDRGDLTALPDGTSVFDLDAGVPSHSLWAVVDLTTGELAYAAPGDDPVRLIGADGVVPEAASGAPGRLLRAQRTLLEILIARPGVGSWGMTVGDGGASDADGVADGALSAPAAGARALKHGVGSYDHPRAGDVILAIDPRRMELSATRIGQPR